MSLPTESMPSGPSTPPRGRKASKATVAEALKHQSYLPPPADEDIAHSAVPLDGETLSKLAKKFADSIPDEEFSVAALQGCKLGSFQPSVFGVFACQLYAVKSDREGAC